MYKLTSQKSGVIQPIYVAVFASSKEKLRNLIEEMSYFDEYIKYDALDFLRVIRRAYENTFFTSCIRSGFSEAGLNGSNHARIMYTPRPLKSDAQEPLETGEDIKQTIDPKCSLMSNKGSIKIVVLRKRYVDKASGLCLTSSEALDAANEKDKKYSI